jgi:hypothetical protein
LNCAVVAEMLLKSLASVAVPMALCQPQGIAGGTDRATVSLTYRSRSLRLCHCREATAFLLLGLVRELISE